MKRLDMTGNPCPIPVVEARKALEQEKAGTVEVIVDNEVAVKNLQKMADGKGYTFSSADYDSGRFLVTLEGEGNAAEEAVFEAVEKCGSAGELVVLIKSDCMGSGSDELGRILIKGYVYTLTELNPLPKSVIFLNGGARLTTDGANTVADLKKLEEMGVEVLTCGTCLNFYDLTEKLEVGGITDMMGISKRIAEAGRLVCI